MSVDDGNHDALHVDADAQKLRVVILVTKSRADFPATRYVILDHVIVLKALRRRMGPVIDVLIIGVRVVDIPPIDHSGA